MFLSEAKKKMNLMLVMEIVIYNREVFLWIDTKFLWTSPSSLSEKIGILLLTYKKILYTKVWILKRYKLLLQHLKKETEGENLYFFFPKLNLSVVLINAGDLMGMKKTYQSVWIIHAKMHIEFRSGRCVIFETHLAIYDF